MTYNSDMTYNDFTEIVGHNIQNQPLCVLKIQETVCDKNGYVKK